MRNLILFVLALLKAEVISRFSDSVNVAIDKLCTREDLNRRVPCITELLPRMNEKLTSLQILTLAFTGAVQSSTNKV